MNDKKNPEEEARKKEGKSWLRKGYSFERKNKHEEALECFYKSLEFDPMNAYAWGAKGWSLHELGRSEEALKCLDKAVDLKPKAPTIWNNRGVVLDRLERTVEAMSCYEKAIEVRSNFSLAWSNKGHLLGRLGKLDEAIICFDRAIKINPKFASSWAYKGLALLILKRYNEAIMCYDRAIKLEPKVAEPWFGKGLVLHYLEKYNEAIDCYDNSIKISPESPSGWAGKGWSLYKLGRYDEALKFYDKAIDLASEYAWPYAGKSEVLLETGSLNESLEYCDRSIELDPKNYYVWEIRGKALQALGRHAEAEEAFAKARELKEKEPLDNEPKASLLPEIIQDIRQVLERKGQVILYGPPGTGKTYWAERAAQEMASLDLYGKSFDQLSEGERSALIDGSDASGAVRICCFHPAYGYEDFLEGYRPEETDGKMSFALRDGIFKRLCRDASANPDVKFYLIIDEINRGDIPRIFGELMTVLEKNKRGKPIILPVSGEQMRVPENVRVIGTMNTADRSIALLDTALRRRFGFIEMMPDASVLGESVVGGVHLGEWLSGLNRRVCDSVGRDARNRQIGHSYLMKGGKPISTLMSFSRVVQDEIIPLLEEYCYEDYSTLEKILGGEVVDVQRQMIRDEIFEGSMDGDFLRAMSKISKDGSAFCPSMTAGSEESEDSVSDLDEAPAEERTDG
jgi:tetratricopeptide (TPR) repeat protein